jgi:outer membrane protein OmpA-like peptidoglycan-associated protein
MKKIIFILFALISVQTYSQSLNQARSYFDNYEYENAAMLLQQVYDKQGLEKKDLKRIVYAYYVTGDFIKCKPFLDQLESEKEIEPLFYLISGDVNRGTENYSKAISSYEEYQKRKGEENVSLKIQSCREIVNWDEETHVSFAALPKNGKMANLVGGVYKRSVIQFNEVGFDKMQDMLGILKRENSSVAELFLSQPSIKIDTEYKKLLMKDSSFASITSMTFLPNSSTALMTIAYPISGDAMKKAPNLYWATITEDYLIQDVEPFKYSGFRDTSSTAHATINDSGNTIIFTKAGQKTKGADLYITELKEENWSTPVALSMLNTSGDEMFPLFSGDTLLTFSSDGRVGYGGLDIYSVPFPIKAEAMRHYKSPINSLQDDFNYTIENEDSVLFASNRFGGKGDDDIYYITFNKKETIETIDEFDTDGFIANWKIKNVYFDFDKFNLKTTLSDQNIQDLKEFISECPSCVITLTGYTDSRGYESYNLNLSKKRAEEVKSILITKGFDTNNIKVIAKGETEQPYSCGANCSEEQHKLNRVVEINVAQ